VIAAWLRRRRENRERAEVDTGILLAGYEELAYYEARRRSREARGSDRKADRHWTRVALVIARRQGSESGRRRPIGAIGIEKVTSSSALARAILGAEGCTF
jgi:hypothetical protein